MGEVRRAVRVRAAATAGDELCCALGRAVRARREQAGLSQATLAGLVGARQTDVSLWENGVQTMGVRALVLVASAVGVTPGGLLDEGWSEMTPCARLALPSGRAGYRRPARPAEGHPGDLGQASLFPESRSGTTTTFTGPPRARAPEVEEPAPLAPGALGALARLLARAGVPAHRAPWAASLLEEAAAAGVCQVGARRGQSCEERPARLAVRVDRGGRVVARVLCGGHAACLDRRWVVVGPEKSVRASLGR